MTSHLRSPDLAIVALYLIGITLFGLHFREKKITGAAHPSRSLRSYFLADNTIPWWAIALSIVSAETSTLTIISIPGVAFSGDFGFLQIVLGYMIGRVVVALLFLPRYFSGNMLTAYQLIERRFGTTLHKVTAALFLLTRAAAEGVRLFAVSIVVGIAIGTRDVLSIAIISLLTLLYTFEGGMAAVIWTDVIQMAIYIGGTFVAIWSLGHHIAGGWSNILPMASAAGKFHMLNFAFNLTTTYTFWAGVLGGTFLTMASHGTDQLMVQRMLAARGLRESRLALLSSGVVIFIQFTLFLLIGAGLYVFYDQHPAVFSSADRIFPTFIVREMPIGVAGLLIAAIFAAAMSNLSAALNSLSSTTVVDFYMHLRPSASDKERNLIAKSSTLLWAIVLFAIAVYALAVGGKGHVVEIGLSIASVAYGCLLGVFLLGTLTEFATQTGATLGMLCGFLLNLYLWQGTFPKTIWSGDILHCRTLADGVVSCDMPRSILTIPHIAWTWYVPIGAIVTFALGSLFSLLFREQSRRTAAVSATILITVILSAASRRCDAQSNDPDAAHPTQIPSPLSTTDPTPAESQAQATLRYPEASASGLIGKEKIGALAPRYALAQSASLAAPDFSPISTLLNAAVATHRPPGAVVLIGHNNHIVFEQAYGDRKLANEPGLDGKPSRAEPMTEDTIFDMASLSKCLSTATAIMQLYEAGKITSFDDAVAKYLPAFNANHDPTRALVTLRMLLTHTSGEAPDVDLKTPWGLASPNKAEGLHLALTTPLKSAPGDHFEYSDINFILLGDIVETLSGEPLDVYAQKHIFKPLGMTDTRYLPMDQMCGVVGVANWGHGKHAGGEAIVNPCGPNVWEQQKWLPRIAPEAHDNEGTPATNPDYDHLLRGTVHDPTTRRMGGVAGHAGVFSTAHDVSVYASALLEKLLHNTGPFPLKQSTLQLMTSPQQPGHTPHDLSAANAAQAAAIANGDKPAAPGLGPHYPAIRGHDIHGLGWDIDTAFSKPRGLLFPIGSFGHTGFTGTSLWMDPYSDTYVILLANAIHPRGNPPLSNLRGQIATATAKALGLAEIAYQPKDCDGKPLGEPVTVEQAAMTERYCRTSGATDCPGVQVCATSSTLATMPSTAPSADLSATQLNGDRPRSSAPATNRYPEASDSSLIAAQEQGLQPLRRAPPDTAHTHTGIDVLESTHFAALAKLHTIALLTNQTGLDAHGARTIDILNALPTPKLTTLFSPEHGIFGAQDSTHITAETDPATHLHVISLYGPTDADKRPTHDQLKSLDAVVIDLQDVGVRFYTYETVTAYFLEAAAREQTGFHHNLEIILLDRPNPIGGLQVQGPVSDPDLTSYIDYMPLPVRHGLTLGELCRYIIATKHLATHLTVIPMQHWSRSEYFDQTNLTWTNPSPNLRSLSAATLYPALGFLDYTPLSVGRGTFTPFELFAAAWLDAPEVAAALTGRQIHGATFAAITTTVAEDANHYPFHGQTIPAVRITVTDRNALDSSELGIEILSALHRLAPARFQLDKTIRLLGSRSTLSALQRGDDPRSIASSWTAALEQFKSATTPYLLYK